METGNLKIFESLLDGRGEVDWEICLNGLKYLALLLLPKTRFSKNLAAIIQLVIEQALEPMIQSQVPPNT